MFAVVLIAVASAGCTTGNDTVVLKVAHNGSVEHPYEVGLKPLRKFLSVTLGDVLRFRFSKTHSSVPRKRPA